MVPRVDGEVRAFLKQLSPDGPGTVDPVEALRSANLAPRLIEDRLSISESLEWRLSELYWSTSGVAGFLQNDVPYMINNSGLLSAKAAQVLYQNCVEAPPREPIVLIEIGAGTGLFARFLMEEFRLICRDRGADFYDRVTYYVTDRSPRTVARWQEDGTFEGYEDRIQPALCDAVDPRRITVPGKDPVHLSRIRAVFANYVLDSLPFTVLRRGAEGVLELTLRTHLSGDAARVAQYTKLGIDDIRKLAASPDPSERAKLIPLVSLLEFEAEFTPALREYAYAEEALTFAHDKDRVTLNYAAVECLENALEILDPHGFVLLNDYGATQPDQIPGQAASQRFGSSTAIGLNFPLLDFHFEARGKRVAKPDADASLPIHPRLITAGELPQTTRMFLGVFGGEAHQAIEGAQERARAHLEAGRYDQARNEYQSALELLPRDWRLLGEVAEFLIRHIADYEAGLRFARLALDLNPWYSVWLWNVAGDALFALNRYDEAHQCYVRARQIEPADPRTQLNLAYTYTQAGDHKNALQAIADGLACDRTGVFRERLVEKQAQILTLATAKYTSEQEWLARRAQRLLRS